MNTKKTLAGISAALLLMGATPSIYATNTTPPNVVVSGNTQTPTEAPDSTTKPTVDNSRNETNLSNEETKLELYVDGTQVPKIVLDLKRDKEVFFNCKNINPGDVLKSTIEINANPNIIEDADVSIYEIVNMLPDDVKAKALLDELELEITTEDGALVYKGKMSGVTTPVTPMIKLLGPNGANTLKFNIKITFPKTAGNEFQNSKLHTKWVFTSRGEIPDPPPPTVPNDEIATGDEGTTNKSSVILGFAIGFASVAGVSYFVVKKKKKND